MSSRLYLRIYELPWLVERPILWDQMRKQNTKSLGRREVLAKPAGGGASTLVNHNVTVGGRRTSLRLEPAMWDALEEICQREKMTEHELCGMVDGCRHASSLTAAVRVFIVTYFRAAATEEGHANIGHGALYRARARRGPPRRPRAQKHGESLTDSPRPFALPE